jgi:EAL domain-containing protein (putative c-di-GMP-specific phosphodiesterase class I)
LTELFKEVDAACYMAKESGGNRIHIYSPHNEEIAMHMGEMQWVAHIQRALEEDSFSLYAQAIEPMNGNTHSHYELLIRMLDDNGSIIPPGTFLRAAERYKLITPIDQWVVKNALSLLTAHPAFLKKIQFISINLSGPSLADESFLQFVTNQIKHSNIDGTKICFEITETAAISNLFRAKKFISVLREFGCRFALDDFGSGLSSFGYLKNLSIDYLKIDGMFVKSIVDDPIDRAMVKSINEIGQVMGMKTIAEFVENDAIRDILKELGVNYAQGYGVAKPMPFDDLLKQTDRINRSGLTDPTMSFSVEKIPQNSFEQPEDGP